MCSPQPYPELMHIKREISKSMEDGVTDADTKRIFCPQNLYAAQYKIAESMLADMMMSDMKQKMDKSQYGNCKGCLCNTI